MQVHIPWQCLPYWSSPDMMPIGVWGGTYYSSPVISGTNIALLLDSAQPYHPGSCPGNDWEGSVLRKLAAWPTPKKYDLALPYLILGYRFEVIQDWLIQMPWSQRLSISLESEDQGRHSSTSLGHLHPYCIAGQQLATCALLLLTAKLFVQWTCQRAEVPGNKRHQASRP